MGRTSSLSRTSQPASPVPADAANRPFRLAATSSSLGKTADPLRSEAHADYGYQIQSAYSLNVRISHTTRHAPAASVPSDRTTSSPAGHRTPRCWIADLFQNQPPSNSGLRTIPAALHPSSTHQICLIPIITPLSASAQKQPRSRLAISAWSTLR